MKPIKKELYVTGQQLRFSQRPQVDAEGQAAVREFKVESPAGYQNQNSGAGGVSNQQGTIPTIIQYGSTAGEMANGRRSACIGCRHFDNVAWRKFVDASTGPLARAEDKQTIETFKTAIVTKGIGYQHPSLPRDMTVDEVVGIHGICRVLSDWVEGVVGRNPMHWPIVPSPDSTCPPTAHAGAAELAVVTPDKPLGFFVPKDLETEKIGSHRYDEVLRAAQGAARR